MADRNGRAIPADFTITVFEPNCQGMDDGHVVRIIFHELLHVGIGEDKGGNESCLVLPHDLEDFRACVDWRGIDWHGRASTMGDREPRDGGGDAREGLPDEEPSRRSLGGGDDWAMRTSR